MDFIFDDYPQIVLNKALFPLETFADLVRVWHSGNTGPGAVARSRCLPLPFRVALSGVACRSRLSWSIFAIHLVNGVLIYLLARAACAGSERIAVPARFPINRYSLCCWPHGGWEARWLVSTVLYVVQRMTSLAATFSLLGLLFYIRFRRRDDGYGLIFGGLGLLFFIACSFLSKEIGVLTLIYVYLVEWVVFQFRSSSHGSKRILAFLRYSPIVATAFVAVWLWRSYDFDLAYGYRPFTLSERVLTEARIVWFYIFQIFVPNVSWLTFYHDDFVISTDLLTPPSTLLAVLGPHCSCLLWRLFSVRRAPLVGFGIFWFYGGHLLESTMFPLELIFEHRNYLPMFGLYVAVLALAFLSKWSLPDMPSGLLCMYSNSHCGGGLCDQHTGSQLGLAPAGDC